MYWYINMKEFVVVEGKSSRIYEVKQGTSQSGVLSPWLFLVFINDLIGNSTMQRLESILMVCIFDHLCSRMTSLCYQG